MSRAVRLIRKHGFLPGNGLEALVEEALSANVSPASERERRLEEALKPFAMFALEGKRGGEFIICKGLFADMKGWDDSPPRECHLHKDDFLRARAALNDGGSNG